MTLAVNDPNWVERIFEIITHLINIKFEGNSYLPQTWQ